MARPALGRELLTQAREVLKKAKTIEELRQAQALILPLEYGFSIKQVAAVTGISCGWAWQLRSRFIRNEGKIDETAPKRGGRRRENLNKEEEIVFLAPFIEKATQGGILVVGEIKRALDARFGREVPLSSVYNLLHRHNWRKLAPDKKHPKANMEVQAEWKKNSRNCSG
jgi:transposase